MLPQIWSAACLYTLVFTHRKHCCFQVCVDISCVLCALWTERSWSSGAALYPRLILMYVKAMAHWRTCTMDWSSRGMCQRKVCVWGCSHVGMCVRNKRDCGQGLATHRWSTCPFQFQPLTLFACTSPREHAHTLTHTRLHTHRNLDLEVWHICILLSATVRPCRLTPS